MSAILEQTARKLINDEGRWEDLGLFHIDDVPMARPQGSQIEIFKIHLTADDAPAGSTVVDLARTLTTTMHNGPKTSIEKIGDLNASTDSDLSKITDPNAPIDLVVEWSFLHGARERTSGKGRA